MYLSEFWTKVSQVWEIFIPVLYRLLSHLKRWLQRWSLLIAFPLDRPEHTPTLYTDVFITERGAILYISKSSVKCVGMFWEWEQFYCHWDTPKKWSKYLLIATDKTTVVAYFQKQGGTHSFEEKYSCYATVCRLLPVRHAP